MTLRFCKYCTRDHPVGLFPIKNLNRCIYCFECKQNKEPRPKRYSSTAKYHQKPNPELVAKRREREARLALQAIEEEYIL
jgi:hypothetical protein